jgi:hypothetical protein
MSRHSRLPLAIAIVLAGCAADTPTAPGEMAGSPAFSAVPVPFRASCEMVIEPAVPIGPGIISQVDSGECRQVTHMGRAQFVSDKVINIPAGTQTTAVTFTAANGDILRGNGTGTSTMIAPGRIAFTATIQFTGGTGRFANATGEATLTGEADLVAGRSSMSAEGSIQY